jgi:prepilin-type N-terminal cleavage/methylation domain-containing protein
MLKLNGFTLIELAIVIVIAAILAAVAIPIYNGLVQESKWSEAHQAVGSFVTGMKVYFTSHSNSFAGILSSGSWGKVYDIAYEIGIKPDSLHSLRYFDNDDFVYCCDVDNNFAVACVASFGAGGGSSGNGPVEGYVVYDSVTGWSESTTQDLVAPY